MTDHEHRRHTRRVEGHHATEAALRDLSDNELLHRLGGTGVEARGHAAVTLPESGETVHVKLVPLTALELRTENRGSTENLFGLPTHYQHRLGSHGFGAWRELEIHRMANEWVLSGHCAHFPLLHHWRVLPLVCRDHGDKSSTLVWGADVAIARRVAAIEESTCSAVLFMERFPATLLRSLQDRLSAAPDPTGLVRDVEDRLFAILSFVHDRGVLHMDAHFENLLTDGTGLFLGDFGLAMSLSFRLGAHERAFFDRHVSFDRCTAITSLCHAVVTQYDPGDDWRGSLRALVGGSPAAGGTMPRGVRAYLTARGPVALAMGDFYRRLQGDLTTAYPGSHLRALLASS